MPTTTLSDTNQRSTDVWKLCCGSGSSEDAATAGIIGSMYLTGAGFNGTNTPGLLQGNVKIEPYVPRWSAFPFCQINPLGGSGTSKTYAVRNTPQIATEFEIHAVFTSQTEDQRRTLFELSYLQQKFVDLLRNAADPSNSTFANFALTGVTFADSTVFGTSWGINHFQDQKYMLSAPVWLASDGGSRASAEVIARIEVWRN